MNRLATLAPAALLGALAAPALAQTSITWYTIDAGGGTSTGGGYTLSATIGQPDAGPAMTGTISGTTYTLTGGFWAGITPCRPDWNNDGAVNSADVTAFLTQWFADRAATPQTTAADYDASGATNSADVTAFIGAWFSARANGC